MSVRSFIRKKLLFLPNSYQVNDRKRVISDKTFNRSDVGLPSQGFVFCCFNNKYKITPHIFDLWMRILSKLRAVCCGYWKTMRLQQAI